MLEIPCPYCGPRDETEFTYGGDARATQSPKTNAGAEVWIDHTYLRRNPKGPHTELWLHRFGCRRWLKLQRDTVTQAITWTAPAHVPDPAP